MKLTADEQAELLALVNSREVPANVATRARIVLWRSDGLQKKEIAAQAEVSRPTVDLWLSRYQIKGVGGLIDRPRGAPREQVPASIRGRVLALTRTSPPAETGLSRWSCREMAKYVTRTTGVSISWHYVAKLWRDNDLKPCHCGTLKNGTLKNATLKVGKHPAFAKNVGDIVGLYLDSPEGAVVLDVAAKTRIHAPDRTRSVLPVAVDASATSTHDHPSRE